MAYRPPATYVPSQYRSPYAETIGQLLGQNRSIAGRLIPTLGSIAAGAVYEHGQQKQQERQEQQKHAAEMDLIQRYSRGEATAEMAVSVLGKDGLILFNGLESAKNLAEGRTRNAKEDANKLMGAYIKADPKTQATLHPELVRLNRTANLFPPEAIPGEWSPGFSEEVSRFYHSMNPKKEKQPLIVNNQAVDQDTMEVLGDFRDDPKPVVEKVAGEEADLEAYARDRGKKAADLTWQEREAFLARRAAAQRAPVQPSDTSAIDADAQSLLTGNTADKLLGKNRSLAIAAAKASGGVAGTGFVPMNNTQQTRFGLFMDVRDKAMRLRELLKDPEISSQLGVLKGRVVQWTKEGIGGVLEKDTKVKEAFDLMFDLSDTELRKRSGAAINPDEYRRILGFTVTPVKNLDSNMTNLDRMINSVTKQLNYIGAVNLPGAEGVAGPDVSGRGWGPIVRNPDGTYSRREQ